MSYTLPDEPVGAVRPDLAVGAVWPLLTLMLVGPFFGFVWLAFNAWALGSRHALRHTIFAGVAIPAVGILIVLSALLPGGLAGTSLEDNGQLVMRLTLIAIQAAALGIAFWMMMQQDNAEEWRKTFGPPLSSGVTIFLPLLIGRLFLGHLVPDWIQIFVFWQVV